MFWHLYILSFHNLLKEGCVFCKGPMERMTRTNRPPVTERELHTCKQSNTPCSMQDCTPNALFKPAGGQDCCRCYPYGSACPIYPMIVIHRTRFKGISLREGAKRNLHTTRAAFNQAVRPYGATTQRLISTFSRARRLG